MTTKRNMTGALLLIAAVTFGGMHLFAADEKHEHAEAKIDKAIAVVRPTQGNRVRGTVTFTEANGKVTIVANFQNLKPNARQAIHIHEFGDIRARDGMATGGHYNPEGHEHGLPTQDKRHAGDLGNLQSNAEGRATLRLVVDNITVAGHKNPILGRSIIVHENADDGGQPVGNAGPRVSQGVIGVANPTPPAPPAAATPAP